MTISRPRWTARRLVRGRAAALLLALAVLTGLVARVAIEATSPVFASDTFQSFLIAQSLMDGRGFTSTGSEHPDASRMVLFPALVAAGAILTGDVETAARAIVLLSGALIVVPMFFLARSAFGPSAALAALPIGAVSCIAGASSRILVTPIFALVVLATVGLAWHAARRRKLVSWIAAGSCAGLAALARPEGTAVPLVLATWALCAGGGFRLHDRPGLSRRAASAGVVIAAFFLIYAPYVAWASSRLGRFAPWPSIEYVQAERRVSDHLGIREFPSPVAWTTRARYMLTADHRARFLETYFLTGSFPKADQDIAPLATGPAAVEWHARPSDDWRNVAWRRWYIVRGNLLSVPRNAAWAHFLPPAIVGLALMGFFAAFGSRRSRFALLLLVIAGAGSLAPFASHVENRFFYPPFAIGAVLAAGGWGALADVLARKGWPVVSQRSSRLVIHALIAAGIAISGMRHEGRRTEAIDRATLLREQAAALRDRVPAGPVLAIGQHLPYWLGRTYRPIPFATREGILDYAKTQGAVALVLEGTRDLSERPDLTWLTGSELPSVFKLVRSVPHPSGGSLLVFTIDSDASRSP